MNNYLLDYPSRALAPVSDEDFVTYLITKAGRRYLEAPFANGGNLEMYFEVGHLLQRAADELGASRALEQRFSTWQKQNVMPFSYTSAACYMRLARYANGIVSAGITRVKDAEKFAIKKENAAWQVEHRLRTAGAGGPPRPVTDHQNRFFAEVFSMSWGTRTRYLQALAAEIHNVLSL